MILAILAISAGLMSKPPEAASADLAYSCMAAGENVIVAMPNQVRCEQTLSPTQKVNVLFLRFHQRNYTPNVRQYVQWTLVPAPLGSWVQSRVWIEADIGSQTRTYEVTDEATLDRARMRVLTASTR